MHLKSILFGLLALACASNAADPRLQGRSMVISRGGIAATEHPLASQAAAQILARGGNAIDAAVAANAVMGVVSPSMCGIGGDLFALVYDAKSGKTYGLNASGWSPQGLTPEFLKAQGFTNMPIYGIHSVTVPGAVEGWAKLVRRFGTMRLSELLRPAIHHASEGVPVTEFNASYWQAEVDKLKQTDSATRTYLPNGRAPQVGEVFRNPDLAWTYRQIARRGRDGFYRGAVAERILALSRELGGTLNADDLRLFEAEWVEPISTTYHGWTVYEIPPSGQGIAALSMLNIMERFPLAKLGPNSPDSLHFMIEAKKLAYADMLHYSADMRFSKVPVREMLSKRHAEERAKLIVPERANCETRPTITFRMGPDTTYLCVVDAAGNMVSLIQSIYYSFATGLVPAGTGFVLQNRGGLFSLDPAHPNLLAPRKRPLHTIIPAIMERGDQRIAFGIMGGWNQAQAHAQFVSKIVDHRMNIQAALEHPRFTRLPTAECEVRVESRVDENVRAQLEKRGHKVRVIDPFSQDVGGGQAVLRDYSTGVNFGASDPRKDGAAIPAPLSR